MTASSITTSTNDERAVLGCAVRDDKCAALVLTRLSEDDFTDLDLGDAFRELREVWKKYGRADAVTVSRLPHAELLVSCADTVPSLSGCEIYIAHVKEKAVQMKAASPVIIKAKQNDRNTRYIAAHLYVDGLAYPVPSGTEIAFRYKKPDGTAGFYDALPDNSPAITVSGNTVTVELVEQVLTAAGCVHCEINMYNAASEKLTTFTFEISVEESVLTDAEIISSDYYNVLTAEIAKALQAVTDATEQAENAAQSAQDAADSAAMSKDWAAGQPVTYSGTPVSIAYAGAQRIASITAYGETPQGGTVEAPVALTGISSVTVNEDVTELPIPRALHEVGDVRDVCRTRVKSIYDKRIVLDGTESWFLRTENPNSFALGMGERVVIGVSNNYASLRLSELGTRTGIYLKYTMAIVITHLACSTVEELKAKLAENPVTVYYQSTAYDGTNGLDVCLTEYQTGFVELDGETLAFTKAKNNIYWDLPRGSSPGIASGPHIINSHFPSNVFESNVAYSFIFSTKTKMEPYFDTVEALNAYLAAQKAAGTPVQVAYQLATPEIYATDPLDIDNAAGPLTVMTGGELEVRMTELVGTRSDVSNNTVAFTETAQDADIASGEKLSVLFGKIKKRFAVIASNLSNIYNKTESDERYATATQGEKADNALPKTGGTISGNLTVVQDLTVQRAFNGMMIKAGTKTITTPTTSAHAELFNSDTLNELFGTTGVTYTNVNCVVMASNGDYDFHPRVVTSGYVNSKWAVFTADAGNFTISTMRVNYIAIKFA